MTAQNLHILSKSQSCDLAARPPHSAFAGVMDRPQVTLLRINSLRLEAWFRF